MILIKRRCKFFNSCHYVSINSKTCTENAGGDYCGVFRSLSELQKKRKKMIIKKEEVMRNDN